MEQLGIHTYVWTAASKQQDLEMAMERTSELGYDLLEFPRLDPRKFDIAALGRRRGELGLKAAVSMGLPVDGDVSSEDPAIVRRGEAMLEEAVAVTRDVGGHKLAGIIYSAHRKYATAPTRKGWQNSVAVLARVAEKARAAGVTLNLELVNRFESNLLNTVAQGLAFIRDTGSDNIFVHLDTFHMNIEEADPARAIRLAGDQIGYFHIGESNRGYLGSGTINFDTVFDALIDVGYADCISFESFSSEVVDQDLSMTCAIWRNVWTDNVSLARHAKSFVQMRSAEAQRRADAYRTRQAPVQPATGSPM